MSGEGVWFHFESLKEYFRKCFKATFFERLKKSFLKMIWQKFWKVEKINRRNVWKRFSNVKELFRKKVWKTCFAFSRYVCLVTQYLTFHSNLTLFCSCFCKIAKLMKWLPDIVKMFSRSYILKASYSSLWECLMCFICVCAKTVWIINGLNVRVTHSQLSFILWGDEERQFYPMLVLVVTVSNLALTKQLQQMENSSL